MEKFEGSPSQQAVIRLLLERGFSVNGEGWVVSSGIEIPNTGLRQLAAIADDAGVPMAHHCAFGLGVRTAAILHAVSGIPGFSLPPDTVYYG